MYKYISLLLFLFVGSWIHGQDVIPHPGYEVSSSIDRDDKQAKQTIIISFSDEDLENWDLLSNSQLTHFPIDVDLDLKGQENADIINYTISIPDARSMLLHFSSVQMMRNESLQVYDQYGEQVLLLDRDTRASDHITKEIIGSDLLIATKLNSDSELAAVLKRIYINPKKSGRDLGFNTSLPCEINANCQEGDHWKEQKNSVVRIMMTVEEGIAWCTGTLMNNTAKDGRPLVLSANHCQSEFTPIFETWRFDFNYESSGCQTPADEPSFQSLTGCVQLANGAASDFALYELQDQIPVFYNVFFSGWDKRDNYEPEQVSIIHHPNADIKKVSIEQEQIDIFGFPIHWDNGLTTPTKHHYKLFLDQGIHEGGSSGCGLFDPKGRVIGQLHGGSADCETNFTYIGRLFKSWDLEDEPSGRLSNWLDPLDIGIDTLDGIPHPLAGEVVRVNVNIKDIKERPLPGVEVTVSGEGFETSYLTDENGQVTIDGLPRDSSYQISVYKNVNPKNGISALDLLLIQKHLLGSQPFDDELKVLASDANGNGTAAASDLLVFQKVILDKLPFFPTNTSWKFAPEAISIPELGADSEVELNIYGIKLGDVNGTADPNQ